MDIERIALEQGREVEREANRLRQVQKTLRLLPKVLQVPSIPDPLTNAIQSLSLDAIDRLSEDLLSRTSSSHSSPIAWATSAPTCKPKSRRSPLNNAKPLPSIF
jgi:hypothetical protein